MEKTKQCHSDSSVFQSGDLMRKKNIHLKVPFRKRGRAVTLSDDASFLSAILNEGPVKFHLQLIPNAIAAVLYAYT